MATSETCGVDLESLPNAQKPVPGALPEIERSLAIAYGRLNEARTSTAKAICRGVIEELEERRDAFKSARSGIVAETKAAPAYGQPPRAPESGRSGVDAAVDYWRSAAVQIVIQPGARNAEGWSLVHTKSEASDGSEYSGDRSVRINETLHTIEARSPDKKKGILTMHSSRPYQLRTWIGFKDDRGNQPVLFLQEGNYGNPRAYPLELPQNNGLRNETTVRPYGYVQERTNTKTVRLNVKDIPFSVEVTPPLPR